MDAVNSSLRALFIAMAVLFLVGSVVERKFRQLLGDSAESIGMSSRGALDITPREAVRFVFLRGLLARRYARHPDPRVRRWGDALLVSWYLFAIAFMGFVGLAFAGQAG